MSLTVCKYVLLLQMFRLAVVALLIAVGMGMRYSFDNALDSYWQSFKTLHNKHYGQNDALRYVSFIISKFILVDDAEC